MPRQYVPYVLPLLMAAAVSAALALYVWRRRHVPGAGSFTLLILAVVEWSLGYALELGSTDLSAKVFWSNINFLGIAILPTAWLIFALQYTGQEKWLTRRNLVLLAIEPIVTLLLAWTNEAHGLLQSNVRLDTSGPLPMLAPTYSVGFWVHVTYSYLLVSLVVFLILRTLVRPPRLYRGQAVALLIGALVPWVGNALHIFGLSPVPHLDLTPFAFTLSGLAMAWGLFRFRLLDLVPVARDAVIEDMSDGVIVMDAQNRIVDLNPAAQRIIGCSAEEAVGQPAAGQLSGQLEPIERYQDVTEAHTEIVLGEGETRCTYDLRASSLYDQRGHLTGRLVVLRDITARKQAEQTLRGSDLKHRTLFEAATDAIFLETLGGDVLDCNTRACEMFGYTKEELLSLNVVDLVTEEVAETLSDIIAKKWLAGAYFVEAAQRRKDGTVFPAEVSARLVTLGKEQLVVAYVHDITERKRAEEALRKRTAQLEALRQVNLEITDQLDPDMLLRSIVSQAIELLGGNGGGLYLYRPDRDVLEWVTAIGPPTAPIGTILRRGEGLSGKVWETGESLAVDDYQHWEGQAAVWEGYPIGAVVGVPIRWADEFLGVLDVSVQTDTSRSFSPADAELLDLFATQAAIAIRNAQLYEEIRQRALEQRTLREAALALTTTLDLDEVIERILARLQEVVPYDTASVQLLRANPEHSRGEDRLEIVGGRGFPNLEELLGLSFPVDGDNPNREVVRTRAPFIVADAPAVYEGFRREPHAAASIRSWLGVPMLVGERLVGMLALDKHEPGFYTQEHAQIAEAFAAQATIAVENSRLFQAEREQRELAEALEGAAAALSSTLQLDQVLDHILEQVERVVAGDAFNIMLVNNSTVRPVRWRGYERFGAEGTVSTVAFHIPEFPSLRQMVETGEPVVIHDTGAYPGWQDVPGTEWLHSYVAAPIQVGGVTVGFLNVDSTRPGQFGPADARRLAAFANHAATALENAWLFGETQQRVAELEALRQTSLQLTSSLDPSAVLDSIAASALALVGASDCHIYLYDETTETLTFGTALWEDGRRGPAVQAPRPNGLTATTARQGRPIIVSDAHNHPLFTTPETQKWNLQAIAGFPLKRANQVLGVFTIAFLNPHTFSQEELRVLGLLTDQAAIAIENAQLYQQLWDHAEQLEQRVQERTAQLQAQYARLDAILRSATDGIIVTDAEGEIIQANPVAQAWLTQTLSPEDAAWLQEAVQDLARQAEKRPETVLELTGLDLELRAAPVSQSGMEERAAVVAVHDVSHLKALDRMKSRFVSNVSHELRTPVTTIKLYAALLQQMPPEKEEWAKHLDTLAQEADRQAQLVENILQISHIDTGRLEMRPRPTSLNELTRETVANYQILAQKQGLALEHRPAEPGPVALVDPARMTQVLNNLVENAIRYTPQGGKVVVSTGREEAEGRTWATATVVDTGMGIPEEELPHIFERFFRGKEPRLMQISGTGLGLAIAKEIVGLHGGRVTVESEVDVGTTFVIWLPPTK